MNYKVLGCARRWTGRRPRAHPSRPAPSLSPTPKAAAAMRLLIAMMKHETNTFSPVPTDWRRFEDWGLHRGEGVPAALAGTNTPTGAYLDLARAGRWYWRPGTTAPQRAPDLGAATR